MASLAMVTHAHAAQVPAPHILDHERGFHALFAKHDALKGQEMSPSLPGAPLCLDLCGGPTATEPLNEWLLDFGVPQLVPGTRRALWLVLVLRRRQSLCLSKRFLNGLSACKNPRSLNLSFSLRVRGIVTCYNAGVSRASTARQRSTAYTLES